MGKRTRVVGSVFLNARRAQRLSQAQVAAMTRGRPGQISRTMVSLIERGHHLPGLEATVALSRALHVEPSEIFERVDLAAIAPPEGFSPDGHSLESLREQAKQCSWAGEHRQALAICDSMLRRLEREPPDDAREATRIESRIEIHRSSALRHCGALAASRAAAERVVALADEHPDLQARGYMMLASLFERRGIFPLARDTAQRAVDLSPDDDFELLGMTWLQLGSVFEAWSRHADARKAFLQARKFVRAAGDFQHLIHVEGNLGASLAGMGQIEQARRRYGRAVELARRHHVPASEAFWLVELGRVSYEAGRDDEADRYAEMALVIAQPRGIKLTVFRAECLRFWIAQRKGLPEDRHRMARLRKLYSALQDHGGVEEIRWFRETILDRKARR